MIRGTSLAILALLALVVLATGSVFAGPRQQAMNDATLSSLTLSDVTLGPTFDPNTDVYDGTTAHDVAETTVTATPTNPNANVVIKIGITDYPGGVVPLRIGSTAVHVVVTAEDSTTIKLYTITVARPLYIATRSISPSTVAPGGTVAVTLTYGPGAAIGSTQDVLPEGFSWIVIPDDDQPAVVTITIRPIGSTQLHPDILPLAPGERVLEVLLLAMVASQTVEIRAPDVPGIYTIRGVHRDFSRDQHTVLGDTQIMGALPPGVTVSPTDLTVDEGGTGTYTVVLNTQPTDDVTVTVNDPTANTDVTAEPASLTFTTTNWDTAQTVTVSAAEDGDPLEDTATVTHTVSGGDYAAITAQDVAVTVDDDDKPGITFTPASLTVGEAGVGTYGVRLNAAPTADVTVAISSSNPDVTVNTSSLTFTTVNYATNQRVDVTAAEDADAADDTANLRHRPSGGGYGSGQNKDLIVTVTDYDTARLMLSTTFLDVDEGGQNTYTVKLQTQPTITVTVTVSSDDTDAATVSGPTLRFTPSNWDTEQTVTVRGVNDGDSDGELVTITNTASGGEYAGVTETVWLFVDDDDTRGITFTPAARTIREGATGTYDVKLNTAPTADVTVAISSDNADVTVNKSSLTFTTVNYARNQRVTVTAGQDADAADGTANLTHRPTGGDYSAGEAKDFMVTVTDDDTAGLVLSATTLGVDEAGQNTYTVKLQTQPTVTVTVTVSSDDTGAATVIFYPLRFTTSNWDTERTVIVEGVDDGDSANETVTVTNTASGGEYEGVTASVRVTVDDDDKPGITFTPASLTVGEAGVGTYGVRLNAAPTADVTVAISSSNPDVTVNTSSLTFTTVNYATNQRVDVTAAEDADAADDTANLRHRPSGGGYGSGQNKDLIVTVTDYDTAGLMLSTTFLDVDEGGQNTYTVKLQTQPTITVTVTVSSDDTDAATVSGPTLRFTPSNWDTEQTVTVRGVNDGDSDDEIVTITHTASGGEYAGVTETVRVTVDDDDTRGITFTPAARTIREGATGTYDVKLNTAPTADVTVAISSDNTDVTVNKSSLTFTTVNYARNQRVTVTAGQDADAADGTANLTHRPSGGDYSAGEAKDFMVTVTDDDTAGLVLSATTLGVDEAGQNTYTVKLQTQPTVTVTVTVSSDDTGAATVIFYPLRFTTSNWDTERTVIVEGVDDGDSANETVTVTNTASGGEYEGVTASVRVTVDDDDKPGITFTPTSLTVGEGDMGTYTVKLNTLPTGNVMVDISSNNTDVTVSPSSLTFTAGNWNSTQTVTVSAGQDADAADDMATLTHNPSGADYGSVGDADLAVTVTDDETAGVTVTPTSLTVTEGGMNTYTVVLDTQPTATVTVTIVDPTDNADVTANPASLTFTTTNWDTAQTVTVSAAEDGDPLEDTATVTHTVSGGDYAAITAQDVAVTVTDNDTPGVTVAPTSLTVGEGDMGTYTVKLNTLPTGNVMVDISSNNTDVTVSPSSLTFTAGNWNSTQTVTVSAGQDADAADDMATLTHNPSGADYGSVGDADLAVTVTDDETAGVTVTPTSLTVNEGGTNTYTIVLDTEPTDTVTVAISSNNTDVTVSASPLTVWDTALTVTVSAAEDADSTHDTATVTHTVTGGDYNFVINVIVTVTDNDTPGVTVTPLSLTIGEGSTGTYAVVLNTQPSGNVMVAISSNNTDVTVSPSSLTFTAGNWNSAQTVTVSAGQDDDAANDMATLTHNPSGANYGSVSNAILMVTVTDDETAGVTVTPTSLTVNEGGTNTYTVVLDTQPTATVTVTIVDPTDNADVTANPASLRFSTSNWATAQTVTVSADEDDDPTQDTATVTHTVAGGDYASFAASSVAVTVTDNDTPGVTVTPMSLTVGEGGTGRYTVRLNTLPTGNVLVAISSNNTDVTVPSSTLTFTTTTWSTEQTVTVTAGQDPDAANDMATLTHNPSGADYDSVSNASLTVTVTDNDTRGVTVSRTSLTISEGGSGMYTVKLNTQPSGDVTVTVNDPTDNSDVTAGPASLTFSTSDWNTEQTVTVSADEDADSTQDRATVTHTVSGGDYGSVTASGVSVTVTDNDTPGVTVTPPSLTVGEGGTGRYTVRLNTQPSGNVMVAISSNNTDVTVSSSTLTFTTTSWSTEQTVTVSAGQDADAANDMATLTHNPSGGGYGSVSNAILMVTVTDDDTAGLMLSTPTLGVDEGGQAAYTVKLQTQPTTTVTVTVSSDDTDAATVSGPTLRFTTSNWDTEQTVTVRGVNDGDSTDEIVTITHTASGGEYAGVTASVTVTVDDDDTRGITFTPAARTIREGATGTYDVKLNTAPTADVTVAISSDNTDVTVNKSSLTFTTVNYARNQRVTVTAGQDADAADGTANLTHRPSGGDYSAGEAKDFMVTVTDDDTAGLVLSATTLGVDEAGQNTYTVKLQTQPTTTVTVTVSSDDPGAATATVSGSTLIFTASNWDTEQTVTVEGVDDGDSANETVTVTNTASGGEYEGVTASVRVTVDDDDKPGITFTPASLTVGEAGVGTYGVRLNAAPTADVTVAISSSNPDVTVNTSSLTFTTVNYATNQRVDVTAAEDADAADDTANLRHRPSGGGYGSGQNKDLIVTVTDYDTARLMLSTTFLDVDEGGQNTYTVKLQTQPTITVTVTVSSDDTDAATVSGPTLRFTPSNWDTEQTVTVRGVNDGDSDGELVTITNTASGGEYAGVTETVWLFVDDDDTRGITFTPAARTIREGATGTYDVKLNTAPTADVTVAISSDNADVTVNKSSLTFTTVNYARNQRVTVTAGQDADAADGTANLTHRPTGGDYSAGEAKDFMVTVTDDDTAGLVLSATTLGVDEAGQNTYTVKLQTQPTVTVTVTVSSDDTGAATVIFYPLRFTTSNWDTERTVIVEGVDDGDSANETVTVTNTASGGEYEGVTASVRVTVDDDDKPGITFTPASLTVGEAGVGTYGVRLNAAPTADVTVAISSSNPDVTVNTSSLTFTTVNYATNQRVDVTAAEDADAADDTANLRHRPSGGGYGSGQNKDLIVTVTDYDTAGLMLSTTFLDVDEGGQNTYTVKL